MLVPAHATSSPEARATVVAHARQSSRRLLQAAALLLVGVATSPHTTAVAQGPAAKPMMLISRAAANPPLAVNAWNGASDGTVLRLHSGCTPTNGDCTWRFQDRMLISTKNPKLAIRAPGARHGAALVVSAACTRTTEECLWTLNANGMLVSAANPRLAVNAWEGARHGTILRLHNGCEATNADCVWYFR